MDAVGNIGGWSAVQTIRIDKVAPDLTSVVLNTWNKNTYKVKITATYADTGGSGMNLDASEFIAISIFDSNKERLAKGCTTSDMNATRVVAEHTFAKKNFEATKWVSPWIRLHDNAGNSNAISGVNSWSLNVLA